MTSLKTLFVLTTSSCILLMTAASDPIGTGGPSLVIEGKDALLTCVVTKPYLNNTVLWRKGSAEIMSAGMNRVTKDKRIKVLHDENPKSKTGSGGDVWVLLIKNTKPTDSDVYACEVNSDPVIRSFQSLTVRPSLKSLPSEIEDQQSPTQITQTDIAPSTQQVSHDFTDCCIANNVTKECIGFCNVHNIIDGTTGIEPEVCEKDFPNIVKCMADGRNHIPCCEQKGIPDICQDMCRGEYTPFTDYLKTRVSCIQHTLPGLQCILQGVQKLPSSPTDVYAEAITGTSLEIGWSPPEKLAETVTYYTVNLSALHNFDPDILPENIPAPSLNIKISSDMETCTVPDLKPFTMYSIAVTAHNKHGESLPSQRIRALTLNRENATNKMYNSSVSTPKLPNIRGCCEQNGMSHRMCLDKMCDPKKASSASLPDFMVCAPWSNVTFNCLANDIDHTSCCRARGIPSVCLPLCSGKVTTLNFSLFKCLRYMPDFSSCLLHGYGVLPGYPTKLRPIEVSSNFAILDWNAPKTLADTITQYTIFFRKLGAENEYAPIQKEQSPLILEDLEPGTYYECYVTALNAHGRGMPSSRLVFRTKFVENIEQISTSYNISKCCKTSNLLPQCLPLCSFNMKLSDMQTLGAACQAQMAIIVKCAAGGRDHIPCCNRRGVSSLCVPLCRGVLPTVGHIASSECLSYAGNILQCLEDGTENIPGPVEDVRVTDVTNSSISLEWSSSTEITKNSTIPYEYIVQYGKVNNMTMYETVVKLENEIHTNKTSLELLSLEPSSLYRILVVVSGIHGTSLPSSMLVINTTDLSTSNNSKSSFGVPSPPHSLQVSSHSANWVTVSWQPPEFSLPHESISYRVYHKATLSSGFSVINTKNLWTRLDNLRPNSQHIIYLEAVGTKGVSLASETLVAWTDPALPAFVGPPTIQPSDIVAEGGSMTVLCLALGNPAPTISLYVGGHLVRQETSRHMVTVIHNVTIDMEHVSCYADNGFGMPMQATRKINISFAPRVQASGITVASIGDTVDLKCTVRSIPNPKTMFWRDQDGRIAVIQGGNYDITVKNNASNPSLYIMNLHILNLQVSDVGDYFCHAENVLGSATSPVSVRIRNTPPKTNITECCSSQNVSSSCMIACGFYVDIDAVINKPECIVDFNKLMKCAADGSDHRKCCADSNVPRKCLNWCRGESVLNAEVCSLQHTRTIVGCFESNRDKLPGPPQNIVVNVVSDFEAKISWEPPSKNPDLVDGYRVFYHEAAVSETVEQAINASEVKRIDVTKPSVTIDGLIPDVLYELVVKAGNTFGASVLTEPVRFTIGYNESTSASQASTAGTISGIVAGTCAVLLAALGIFFYKRRRNGEKAASAVSFENPSYLRGIEQVQIASTQSSSTLPSSNITTRMQSKTGSATAKEISKNRFATAVQAIGSTSPPHYEELKFGQEDEHIIPNTDRSDPPGDTTILVRT